MLQSIISEILEKKLVAKYRLKEIAIDKIAEVYIALHCFFFNEINTYEYFIKWLASKELSDGFAAEITQLVENLIAEHEIRLIHSVVIIDAGSPMFEGAKHFDSILAFADKLTDNLTKDGAGLKQKLQCIAIRGALQALEQINAINKKYIKS